MWSIGDVSLAHRSCKVNFQMISKLPFLLFRTFNLSFWPRSSFPSRFGVSPGTTFIHFEFLFMYFSFQRWSSCYPFLFGEFEFPFLFFDLTELIQVLCIFCLGEVIPIVRSTLLSRWYHSRVYTSLYIFCHSCKHPSLVFSLAFIIAKDKNIIIVAHN